MAEYEGNGDFNYSGDGSSDFKRRDNNAATSVKSDDETEENVQLPEKVNEYIRELLNEKMNLDHKYPHAEKLLDAGLFAIQIPFFVQLLISEIHPTIELKLPPVLIKPNSFQYKSAYYSGHNITVAIRFLLIRNCKSTTKWPNSTARAKVCRHISGKTNSRHS